MSSMSVSSLPTNEAKIFSDKGISTVSVGTPQIGATKVTCQLSATIPSNAGATAVPAETTFILFSNVIKPSKLALFTETLFKYGVTSGFKIMQAFKFDKVIVVGKVDEAVKTRLNANLSSNNGTFELVNFIDVANPEKEAEINDAITQLKSMLEGA